MRMCGMALCVGNSRWILVYIRQITESSSIVMYGSEEYMGTHASMCVGVGCWESVPLFF